MNLHPTALDARAPLNSARQHDQGYGKSAPMPAEFSKVEQPTRSCYHSKFLRDAMTTCTVKRNWIVGGYSAEYVHSEAIDLVSLSLLTDQLLTTISDQLRLTENAAEVVDIKGRNQFDTLLPDVPPPHRDEIFKVGGEIATTQRGQAFEWTPFEAACHAEFRDFEATHHIRHTLRVHKGRTVPEWLPWRLLGQAAPIRPSYFRLGLERFHSRFTFASLGYLPQVTDSILIDASRTSFSVQVSTEQRRWKAYNPFQEIAIFAAIHQALKASLHFDVSASFTEHLLASGRFR